MTPPPPVSPPPPVILLMGPTASGKTRLALDLCERLPCEIVSVDSALVYRGMTIGVAKPTPEELQRAPHRLIDLIEPTESYSAARFRADALEAIGEIQARGRRPLLVGGTMLYFRALTGGLSELPEADPAVRKGLEEAAARSGWATLHRQLREVDPVAAERIHPNDPQRISRALEVYQLTRRPLSAHWEDAKRDRAPWPMIKLGLIPGDRKRLHRRIETRFHQMLEAGFEEEVRALLARGDLSPEMPSMRCVGYRQMVSYLSGACSRQEMIEKGVVATRQLAKRQLTWLRAEPGLHALDPEAEELLEQALRIITRAEPYTGECQPPLSESGAAEEERAGES